MEFEITKAKILQGVNIVKEAIANRTTNPILKTILLEAGEDGWLLMRATNTQTDITVQVKADIKKPGRVCVSDLVVSLLPTFDDAERKDGVLTNPIKFALTDKSLTVFQGKRRHRPVFMSPEQFPKPVEITGYEEMPEGMLARLIEAFQRLNVSASVTEDRRILQGFHINPHTNIMITGDGTRVSLRENIALPGNIANPPAKLIMGILSNLTALGPNDKLEVKTGNMVAFKATQFLNDEPYLKWEIIITGLEGEFPDKPLKLIKESLEKTPKLTVKVGRSVLSKILTICKIYSNRAFDEGKSQHVTIRKNGSGVELLMHIPDLVEMQEPLECESEGDDYKFLFHPGMALDALDSTGSGNIELRFFGPSEPFLILDGTDFIYLQAAMKSKETKNDNK